MAAPIPAPLPWVPSGTAASGATKPIFGVPEPKIPMELARFSVISEELVPVFSVERPLDLGPECLILTSVRAAGRGELGIKAKRRSDGNLSWLQERWRSRL